MVPGIVTLKQVILKIDVPFRFRWNLGEFFSHGSKCKIYDERQFQRATEKIF